MKQIKNCNELYNVIDNYMNDEREIDLERFLSDHEEVSFFDETEEIPKDFEFKTVSAKYNRDFIQFYLIEDYETFQKQSK